MNNKIAVFGPYFVGNFGDDLMALIFSLFIKEIGFHPIVYKLKNDVSEKYNIETEYNLEKFVSNAKIVLYGGGALLTSQCNRKNSVLREYNIMCKNLSDLCLRDRCEIVALSVGGDGCDEFYDLPLDYGRWSLLSNKYFFRTTVRQKQDIAIFENLGKETRCYSDIIWCVESFFDDIVKKQNKKFKVGINLPDVKKYKYFIDILAFFSRLFGFRLCFIRTHEPIGDYREIIYKKNRNVENYTYDDPIEMLKILSSLDIVISNKLHVGMCCLGYGIPFISLDGPQKTKTMLKNINARHSIFKMSKSSAFKIFKIIAVKSCFNNFLSKYDFVAIKREKEDCKKHFSFLSEVLCGKD